MRPFLADHSPFLPHINLVAQYYERETLRIPWGCLNQELVAPRVKRIEGFGRVDVVNQHAAVGAAVEGYAEGLEAFLPGRVPELQGYNAVVYCDLFGEEVGADCRLVGCGELLVDLEGVLGMLRSRHECVSRTYWFIKLVLPTPLSPKMITFIELEASLVRGLAYRSHLQEHLLP